MASEDIGDSVQKINAMRKGFAFSATNALVAVGNENAKFT